MTTEKIASAIRLLEDVPMQLGVALRVSPAAPNSVIITVDMAGITVNDSYQRIRLRHADVDGLETAIRGYRMAHCDVTTAGASSPFADLVARGLVDPRFGRAVTVRAKRTGGHWCGLDGLVSASGTKFATAMTLPAISDDGWMTVPGVFIGGAPSEGRSRLLFGPGRTEIIDDADITFCDEVTP